MTQTYTDLLLRIFPFDEREQCYPVEAELDDGSRFTGGRLRLDREALLAVELDPKAYGLLLFNALFAGDIRRAYDKATGIAEVQSGGRLRVRLWVDNEAVELHALAWERLYHLYRGRAVPLTTSTLTPFSRYTSLEMRDPPPVSETPVRMAIAVSNPLDLPGGLQPVDTTAEIEILRQALSDLQREGKLQVTLLPGRAGLAPEMQKKLEASGWQIAEGVTDLDNLVRLMTGAHIFHFIGHGHFRRKSEHGAGQAALFLEKADGRWEAVRDDVIVSTLTSAGTLPHLIFLVACESATRDAKAESPFVGLGPKLVQTGVPAVVAMQAQVPIQLAQQLSGEFYRRLVEHGEVDQALNQARLAVFDHERIEWAIPVLFMRMKRGKLFGEPEGDEEAPAPGAPPYKGLEYFDEKDADKFFGREALVARLAGQLRESRFLAVILGASGSGKSSVVRAGLVPALRRGKPLFDETLPPQGSARWPIHIFTPGANPLEALAATLTRAEASVTATAILQEELERDKRALHLYVRKLLSRGEAPNLLLIVDQFEESFTLCKDEAQRRAFVDNLIYASNEVQDGPTVVVIIFRADFYAHCAQYANLREAVSRRQEFIGPMSPDELRRAIEEPAKLGGWDLEPGLVDVLLKDVGEEPGALPLLQHALLETWQRRRGRRMTLRGYTESGGIRGAIAKTAEAVYQQLPPEQQAFARRIFLRLVELGEGTQDTRRRAELDELSPRPEERPAVEAVLKILVDHRLVTTTASTAEVAHEALIREWPALRGWLEKNRAAIRIHRELAEAARDWDNLMRESGGLYRGVRLIQALEWADENGAEMNALEGEFLAASKAEAEREAREVEERQQRELAAARQLAEEQARAAEAAQKLAEAEKQRAAERAEADQRQLAAAQRLAEEQARAAGLMRTRNRLITVVGALALVAAVFAAVQWGFANQQRADAVNQRSTAQAAEAVAVTERAQAEIERANAVTQQGLANIASTEAVNQQLNAEASAGLAERNFRAAQARALAAAAVANLEIDPERSVLLALQAMASQLVAVEPGYTVDESALYQSAEAVHRGLATLRLERILTSGPVYESLAYSPVGPLLAVGTAHGEVTVWNSVTGELLATLTGHTGFVHSIAFSPDGQRLATASADATIRIWEVATGESLHILEGHTATVRDVDFSPDGALLVSGGEDNTLRLWNANSGRELFSVEGPYFVDGVAFSPDGARVAASYDSGGVDIWSATSGSLLQSLEGHPQAAVAIAYSPDGTRLVTASIDQTAKVWDALTGRELFTLAGHTDWLLEAAFSADSARIATVSYDNTARLWDARSGQEVLRLAGMTDSPKGVAIRADGLQLATGGESVRLWNIGLTQELLTFQSRAGQVRRVAFNPDGTRLVTSGSDDAADFTASIWDAATGEERLSLTGHSGVVLAVAFSPDGARVATASADGTARVWEAVSGRELFTLSGHQAALRGIAFSPDGARVATASTDGTARVWEAASGRELFTLSGHDTGLNGVAFSPDGTKLATTSDDTSIRVWDADSGEALAVLQEHRDWVIGVAFSPDGSKLVTTSQDKTVKVWDLASGRALYTLTGHSAAVNNVAFSPDGSQFATTSSDRTVKVWDPATGRELYTLYGHTDRVRGVAFSPDGTRLASSGDDGTVRLYVLPLDELMNLARSRVTRSLTAQECERYDVDPCPTGP
jgi:WD40 repeat protein